MSRQHGVRLRTGAGMLLLLSALLAGAAPALCEMEATNASCGGTTGCCCPSESSDCHPTVEPSCQLVTDAWLSSRPAVRPIDHSSFMVLAEVPGYGLTCNDSANLSVVSDIGCRDVSPPLYVRSCTYRC